VHQIKEDVNITFKAFGHQIGVYNVLYILWKKEVLKTFKILPYAVVNIGNPYM